VACLIAAAGLLRSHTLLLAILAALALASAVVILWDVRGEPLRTRSHADRVLPPQRYHYHLAEEMNRERGVIRELHAEYLRTHDNVTPGMVAGMDPLPGVWVVKRLEELGETFRWNEYRP
jgi:hypothetical protein